MRLRRALACAAASSLLAIASCGGKILDESALPAPSATSSPEPLPGPTSGPLPPSPPTMLGAATEIADGYCTAFAGCCKSAGQPPIDLARCREVTEAAIARRAGGATGASRRDVNICDAAIRSRMAICSKVDADWSSIDKVELFAPASIAEACAPIIGKPGKPKPAVVCGAKQPCEFLQTCAIDQCTDDVGEGNPCANAACLDGLKCAASACEPQTGAGTGSPCAESRDCHLGLVCFEKACAPVRAHPELYVERHSPYRVGFDTCRVFTFL